MTLNPLQKQYILSKTSEFLAVDFFKLKNNKNETKNEIRRVDEHLSICRQTASDRKCPQDSLLRAQIFIQPDALRYTE